MAFSILMGGDQIAGLKGWKAYEKVLEYPIYVYPGAANRRGFGEGRITLLDGRPLHGSSPRPTRDRIGRARTSPPCSTRAEYIRRKGAVEPRNPHRGPRGADRCRAWKHGASGRARGKLHYRMGEWGSGPTTSTRRCVSTTRTSKPRSSPDGAGDTGIPIQRYIQPLK